MRKAPGGGRTAEELRGIAEARLREAHPAINPAWNDDQVRAQFHELQVHQIELELQNEELRETRLRLEEARDRYLDLYDFAPVGYLTLDGQGIIVDINLTGAALLGQERSAVVGSAFANCLAPGERAMFFAHLREIFASGCNAVAEFRIARSGEAMRHIRFESVVAAMPGKRSICRAAMIDVSEQKRLDSILQLTRGELKALLDTVPAMVFYKDMDLRYVVVNQIFADFVGRPAADIQGKTMFDLFPPEVCERLISADHAVLSSGHAITDPETPLLDAQGRLHYHLASLAPYLDGQHKIAGLVGICIDISSTREADQRNRELLDQNRRLLRRIFSAEEEYRRHIARELHDELGQWLTAIQAEVQVLRGAAGLAPEVVQCGGAIGESACAIQDIVRGMLRRLRPALLDVLGLADSLRELGAQWRKAHPETRLDLLLEGRLDNLGEPINISVYRIVQEGLTNISKHACAERVTLHLRRESGVASDLLALTLEDDGKGMAGDSPNSGIGLPGIRERVASLGGQIDVASRPGEGLRLEVRLPLAEPEGDDEI